MENKKEIKVNGKEIRFRKWKVKDKKELDKAQTEFDKKKVYVYNCLENPDTPLDLQEFTYALVNIRDYSLNRPLKFSVVCSNCKCEETVTLNPSDIIKVKGTTDGNYKPIVYKDYNIEIRNIRSRDIYETVMNSTMTSSEKIITDFAMHIMSINSCSVDYEQAIDFIENLDVEDFEKILEIYETEKFRVSFVHKIKCSKCGSENTFDFSDMKNFFPETWNF